MKIRELQENLINLLKENATVLGMDSNNITSGEKGKDPSSFPAIMLFVELLTPEVFFQSGKYIGKNKFTIVCFSEIDNGIKTIEMSEIIFMIINQNFNILNYSIEDNGSENNYNWLITEFEFNHEV